MKPAESIPALTIKQLLTNPTGKYSAFMSARYKIIEDLNKRYVSLLNKHKTIKFKVYKKKDNYIFYFKMPSEKYNELFYDVVIEFVYDKELKSSFTIEDYTLKLFSNSPAFTYTYTYVLNTNNMLVDDLKPKCSTLALTQPPSVRNPVEIYGFEKSCYFACKYIMEYGLTLKNELDDNKHSYSKSIINKDCMSQELKINQYNTVKKQNSKANKKIKETKPSGLETVEEFKNDVKDKPIRREAKRITPKASNVNVVKPKKSSVRKVKKIKR